MEKKTLVRFAVRLGSDEDQMMKLVFTDEIISALDFRVENSPSQKEFALILNYCSPVVWSIFTRWVCPQTKVIGIEAIAVRRHTLLIEKADAKTICWENILSELYGAIRQNYPSSHFKLRMLVDKGETANNVVDSVLKTYKVLDQVLVDAPSFGA